MKMRKYPDEYRTPIERGEEQMTVGYAMEWIRRSMCCWSRGSRPSEWIPFKDERHIAGEMAMEALEYRQKYRWHDLRKDPSDLPDDETIVIIQTVKHNQFFAYIQDKQWFLNGGGRFPLANVADGYVPAWRDYDKFE